MRRGSPRTAKRMLRAARQRKYAVVLNIVSLIDIFAILVFYLLVNALVVEILPTSAAVKLPESVVDEEPRKTAVVMVTTEAILVDNVQVMSLETAKAATGKILDSLKAELDRKPRIVAEGALASDETLGELNIMADKSIEYSVLKKVIATCTAARASKISLAVLDKPEALAAPAP